jgi:ankyrin repeat protein
MVLAAQFIQQGDDSVNAATYESGETALTLAAAAGAVDMVRLLLDARADPNQPRRFGAVRPIDLAVYYEHLEVAVLLLEHGAEVSLYVKQVVLRRAWFAADNTSSSSSAAAAEAAEVHLAR